MRHRFSYLMPTLVLLLLVAVIANAQPTKRHRYARRTVRRAQAAPVISQRAKDILQGMGTYINSLKSFSVHGEAAHNVVMTNGERLELHHAFDAYLQRPDQLRVDFIGPNRTRQVYLKGNTLTIFSPQLNAYGTVTVPPTIDQALPAIEQRYGIGIPLADILSGNCCGRMMQNVTSGIYVGPSIIDGAYCNQLAFRQRDVDWQIWIEDSKMPVPRRIVITDKTQPGYPQFMLSLSNWNTTPTFTDAFFTFTPPAGAKKIEVMELRQQMRQQMPQQIRRHVRLHRRQRRAAAQ